MYPSIQQYRELAAQAHREAAASTLPQVKMRYLRSAGHFERLIDGLESAARAKMRNEAAKAEAAD
jgi:hypothetical protein